MEPSVRTTDRIDPHAGSSGNEPAGRAELVRLAQEFEAVLMNEMLSGWRQALVAEGDDGGDESGMIADLVGTEFGRALSRTGGFGIADVVIRALHRQYEGADGSGHAAEGRSSAQGVFSPPKPENAIAPLGDPVGFSSLAPNAPVRERADRASLPVSGLVSSPYGWRADPIDGRPRFHAGADLRMAYGQEVATVAPGRVIFAGDQGGYGLTVVVDHGHGLETRYAHLASVAVRVGENVGGGSVIARSGNSGRSTGPHLHVELLQNGRPIDPSGVIAALAAALKKGEATADSLAYQSVSAGPATGRAERTRSRS